MRSSAGGRREGKRNVKEDLERMMMAAHAKSRVSHPRDICIYREGLNLLMTLLNRSVIDKLLILPCFYQHNNM